jgi:hypothetical protein
MAATMPKTTAKATNSHILLMFLKKVISFRMVIETRWSKRTEWSEVSAFGGCPFKKA